MEEKILVVDDNTTILKLVSDLMREDGFCVFTASTGTQAIEMAVENQPALIIMDIMLPDMDGAEVVGTIQDYPALQDTPVIFLSGLAARETGGKIGKVTVRGREYPAVAKPFESDDLLALVKKQLEI